MDIVITMAGIGQRFKDAGYLEPKYCIGVRGKSLFEWSMESLRDFIREENIFYFVVRKADDKRDFLIQKCKEIGIAHPVVIELEEMTDGQATTALLASRFWRKEEGLLIYNIDTYVEAFSIKQSDMAGDGFIPCFYAEGTHWSFVRTDETGKADLVKEKERISDHCTIGAYYFQSCNLYERLYQEYYIEKRGQKNALSEAERKERYVAPLYQYLIEQGGIVYMNDIVPSRVHVLGTPEELKEFMNDKEY